MLAAPLALLLAAETAEVQTSVKLVSNTGKVASGGGARFTNDYSHTFTTGSHVGGYKLTRVDIVSSSSSSTRPNCTVTIRTDSTGSLGTSLGTLTNPFSLPSSYGLVQYKAPGGINQETCTMYHVMVDVSTGGAGTRLAAVNSNAEDPG